MIDKQITQALDKLGWKYRVIDTAIIYLLDYRAVIDTEFGAFHTCRLYLGDSMYEFRSTQYYLEEEGYDNVEMLSRELQLMMRDLILRDNKL